MNLNKTHLLIHSNDSSVTHKLQTKYYWNIYIDVVSTRSSTLEPHNRPIQSQEAYTKITRHRSWLQTQFNKEQDFSNITEIQKLNKSIPHKRV